MRCNFGQDICGGHRGQPAQCGHRLAAALGQTRGSSEQCPDERDLRRVAFLDWLRRRLTTDIYIYDDCVREGGSLAPRPTRTLAKAR